MKVIKTSEGYVEQIFEDGELVSQRFVAQGECTYEDEDGNPSSEIDLYHPFDMVQS